MVFHRMEHVNHAGAQLFADATACGGCGRSNWSIAQNVPVWPPAVWTSSKPRNVSYSMRKLAETPKKPRHRHAMPARALQRLDDDSRDFVSGTIADTAQ